MISGEKDPFLREYELNASDSFLQFHNYIQKDLKYDTRQLASFFLTDEQWNKGLELTLIDMENDAGFAAIPMESVKLIDLLKKKKEKLLYEFDVFSDRCLFLELSDITEPIPSVSYPRCTASVGLPPEQIVLDVYLEPADDEDDFEDITNDIDSIEDIDFESEGFTVDDY
jgi:hypothetical protein